MMPTHFECEGREPEDGKLIPCTKNKHDKECMKGECEPGCCNCPDECECHIQKLRF